MSGRTVLISSPGGEGSIDIRALHNHWDTLHFEALSLGITSVTVVEIMLLNRECNCGNCNPCNGLTTHWGDSAPRLYQQLILQWGAGECATENVSGNCPRYLTAYAL